MPTIGEQLKQARETRKLTIKQAVVATRVRAHYLEAMEADDFSTLPSPVQARGFLRLYADYLGLDANELNTLLQAELGLAAPAPAQTPNQTPPSDSAASQEEVPAPEAVPAEEPEPAPPAPPRSSSQADVSPSGDKPPLSQIIFNEIGRSLRERRELISLTQDEVERHTHVRKHNLEMIETGCFDDLPSPVQARGMLSAYATLLDMDAEAVLLRYADALQARRVERQQAEPQQSLRSRRQISLPVGLRHFISPDLIFGGSMVVIMLALSVWGAARIFSDGKDAESTPTAGVSISDVLLASPDAMSTENAGEGIPTSLAEIGTSLPPIVDGLPVTETETIMPTVASAVQITVVVLDRTFLRVIVDGEIKQDGRAAPGAALTFDGNERIEVLTGSGRAVQIIFNQHDMGQMGNIGEVVDRIYTINGIETPTPTASPTPTITPKPSRTPRPTLTLPPSRTPRPTSTPRPTLTPTPGS